MGDVEVDIPEATWRIPNERNEVPNDALNCLGFFVHDGEESNVTGGDCMSPL